MSVPFSFLPFGNLALKTAASGSLAPMQVSNFITSPTGQDQGAPAQQPKTPLDMPAAPQSPTEQALGADADTLKLQNDHQQLQAEHQKLQQQLEDQKRQALLAKQQASVKAAPAAPRPDADLAKYKSMSMELMGRHLERSSRSL